MFAPLRKEPDYGAHELDVLAPRYVDGLGQRLLHLHRYEHRVHLALPEGGARARLALQRAPLDRLVPALRHVDLPARALRGRVQGARASFAVRSLPAP